MDPWERLISIEVIRDMSTIRAMLSADRMWKGILAPSSFSVENLQEEVKRLLSHLKLDNEENALKIDHARLLLTLLVCLCRLRDADQVKDAEKWKFDRYKTWVGAVSSSIGHGIAPCRAQMRGGCNRPTDICLCPYFNLDCKSEPSGDPESHQRTRNQQQQSVFESITQTESKGTRNLAVVQQVESTKLDDSKRSHHAHSFETEQEPLPSLVKLQLRSRTDAIRLCSYNFKSMETAALVEYLKPINQKDFCFVSGDGTKHTTKSCQENYAMMRFFYVCDKKYYAWVCTKCKHTVVKRLTSCPACQKPDDQPVQSLGWDAWYETISDERCEKVLEFYAREGVFLAKSQELISPKQGKQTFQPAEIKTWACYKQLDHLLTTYGSKGEGKKLACMKRYLSQLYHSYNNLNDKLSLGLCALDEWLATAELNDVLLHPFGRNTSCGSFVIEKFLDLLWAEFTLTPNTTTSTFADTCSALKYTAETLLTYISGKSSKTNAADINDQAQCKKIINVVTDWHGRHAIPVGRNRRKTPEEEVGLRKYQDQETLMFFNMENAVYFKNLYNQLNDKWPVCDWKAADFDSVYRGLSVLFWLITLPSRSSIWKRMTVLRFLNVICEFYRKRDGNGLFCCPEAVKDCVQLLEILKRRSSGNGTYYRRDLSGKQNTSKIPRKTLYDLETEEVAKYSKENAPTIIKGWIEELTSAKSVSLVPATDYLNKKPLDICYKNYRHKTFTEYGPEKFLIQPHVAKLGLMILSLVIKRNEKEKPHKEVKMRQIADSSSSVFYCRLVIDNNLYRWFRVFYGNPDFTPYHIRGHFCDRQIERERGGKKCVVQWLSDNLLIFASVRKAVTTAMYDGQTELSESALRSAPNSLFYHSKDTSEGWYDSSKANRDKGELQDAYGGPIKKAFNWDLGPANIIPKARTQEETEVVGGVTVLYHTYSGLDENGENLQPSGGMSNDLFARCCGKEGCLHTLYGCGVREWLVQYWNSVRQLIPAQHIVVKAKQKRHLALLQRLVDDVVDLSNLMRGRSTPLYFPVGYRLTCNDSKQFYLVKEPPPPSSVTKAVATKSRSKSSSTSSKSSSKSSSQIGSKNGSERSGRRRSKITSSSSSTLDEVVNNVKVYYFGEKNKKGMLNEDGKGIHPLTKEHRDKEKPLTITASDVFSQCCYKICMHNMRGTKTCWSPRFFTEKLTRAEWKKKKTQIHYNRLRHLAAKQVDLSPLDSIMYSKEIYLPDKYRLTHRDNAYYLVEASSDETIDLTSSMPDSMHQAPDIWFKATSLSLGGNCIGPEQDDVLVTTGSPEVIVISSPASNMMAYSFLFRSPSPSMHVL